MLGLAARQGAGDQQVPRLGVRRQAVSLDAVAAAAAAAAIALKRPVKLVLSRPMMFHTVGHRPRIEQRVRLGASADGKLVSLQHDYVNATSILDDYEENCGEATPHMYSVPNLRVTSGLAKRNIGTPTSMRGPGAVPGLFATESAMDELAVALGHGPGAAPAHQRAGARRGPRPAVLLAPLPGMPDARRREIRLVPAHPAGRLDAARRADARLGNGRLLLAGRTLRLHRVGRSARRRHGARRLGGPGHRHRHLHGHGADGGGDAGHPDGAGRGRARRQQPAAGARSPAARWLTASLVAPISGAIDAAGQKLLTAAAGQPKHAIQRCQPSDLAFSRRPCGGQGGQPRHDGLRRAAAGAEDQVGLRRGPRRGHLPAEGDAQVLQPLLRCAFRRGDLAAGDRAAARIARRLGDRCRPHPQPACRAQPDRGRRRHGHRHGAVRGTEYDPRNGAPMNASLADYVVATNADVPALEVHFVEYPDLNLNALGARGVGEIGLAGTAAAITNAVYHATGVRVRELPLKIEDLL